MPDEDDSHNGEGLSLDGIDAEELARLLAAEGAPEKAVLLQGLRPAEVIRFAREGGYSFSDDGIVGMLLASIEKYGSSEPGPDAGPDDTTPTPYLIVADYIELGRLVMNWSLDAQSRPHDMVEFRMQLDGIAEVPDQVKAIDFIQALPDRLSMVLPSRQMVEKMLERVSDSTGDGQYPLPAFYSDLFRPGAVSSMTPTDTLLARIGERANVGRV